MEPEPARRRSGRRDRRRAEGAGTRSPRPRTAALSPPPVARRARATRVRQRLDEPARPTEALPTGLLAGIAAGLLVIVVGILVLSSGGDGGDEPDRAAQTPGQNEPEPPPPDEVPSPSGTPAEEEPTTPATALEPVEDVTATDYDPSGDDSEHGEEAAMAVDGDASTSWPSEEYDTGELQKDGVGLALAPVEAVPARGLDLETTTPGFDATIYGAEDPVAPDSIDSGWTQIASEDDVERTGRIDLDTASRDFSHYLIWITALPNDENKVEIVRGAAPALAADLDALAQGGHGAHRDREPVLPLGQPVGADLEAARPGADLDLGLAVRERDRRGRLLGELVADDEDPAGLCAADLECEHVRRRRPNRVSLRSAVSSACGASPRRPRASAPVSAPPPAAGASAVTTATSSCLRAVAAPHRPTPPARRSPRRRRSGHRRDRDPQRRQAPPRALAQPRRRAPVKLARVLRPWLRAHRVQLRAMSSCSCSLIPSPSSASPPRARAGFPRSTR